MSYPERFDAYRNAYDALTDFDESDFTPAPRQCPDCGEELDQEANCIGGRLLCPDCWDVAFRKTYRAEAVPVRRSA